MDDLISRQAANVELSTMLKECFSVDDEIIDAVQTTLREISPAQRWIPVTERLPDEQKSYWVCTDKGYQCQCKFTDAVYGVRIGIPGWNVFDLPKFHKVIAWMPLPEPYRKGANPP